MPRASQHRYKFSEKALEAGIKDYLARVEAAETTGNKVPAKERHYDTACPDLALFLEVTGGKTYKFRYKKPNGKPDFKTVAEYGAITIDHARDICRTWAVDLAAGKEIGPQKRSEEDNLSLGQFFEKHYLPHIKAELRSWAEYERNFNRYVKEKAPTLYHTPMLDIKKKDVLVVLDDLKNRGKKSTYMIVRSMLRSMFEFSRKYIKNNHENPVSGTKRETVQKHVRYFEAEERERFIKAVEDEGEPYTSFFKILLLTGLRKSNVRRLEWSDCDFTLRKFIIPAEKMKGKREFKLKMSQPVYEILTILRKNPKHAASRYVFPSYGKNGYLDNPYLAFNRIIKRAGIDRKTIRLHSLRHICASEYLFHGAYPADLMALMDHKTLSMVERYAHVKQSRADDLVDKMNEAITAKSA